MWCARNSMPKLHLSTACGKPRSKVTAAGPTSTPSRWKAARAGNAVLFKGTADLGQADGGVYDWIGRANNTDFIGFYTNAFSTGFFNLKRTN